VPLFADWQDNIAAAQDPLRSLDDVRELRHGIPGAEMTIIDGSGHMVPIEAPEPLACTILSWLRISL
jgi:pimeloyl-ACP methyl ester carboxylesterase